MYRKEVRKGLPRGSCCWTASDVMGMVKVILGARDRGGDFVRGGHSRIANFNRCEVCPLQIEQSAYQKKKKKCESKD